MTDLREGVAFVFQHRLLRVLVATLFFSVLFASVDNVALVFLVRDELHASPIGYGVAAASYGVGMVLAALTLTRFKRSSPAFLSCLAGLVLSGVGLLATGVATDVLLAAVAQTCAGAGNGAFQVGANTIVQQETPAAMLGRAVGVIGPAAVVGVTLASLLSGAVIEITSPRVAFFIGGAGVLATAIPVVFASSAVARGPTAQAAPDPPTSRGPAEAEGTFERGRAE